MNAQKSADYSFDKAMTAKRYRFDLWLYPSLALLSILTPLNYTLNDGTHQLVFFLIVVVVAIPVVYGTLYLSRKYDEYRYDNVRFSAGHIINDIINTRHAGIIQLYDQQDYETTLARMRMFTPFEDEEINGGIIGYLQHIGRI